MTWNPSPKVADCREIARKWGREQVIIIAIGDEKIEMATYGRNPLLCAEAKLIGDVAYNAIVQANKESQ